MNDFEFLSAFIVTKWDFNSVVLAVGCPRTNTGTSKNKDGTSAKFDLLKFIASFGITLQMG